MGRALCFSFFCFRFNESLALAKVASLAQKGVVSPLLANVALHGLVKALGVKLRPSGWVRSDYGKKRLVVRYADDFVVLTTTYKDALEAAETVKNFLSQRGLTLKKTEIRHVTQGFDFLG